MEGSIVEGVGMGVVRKGRDRVVYSMSTTMLDQVRIEEGSVEVRRRKERCVGWKEEPEGETGIRHWERKKKRVLRWRQSRKEG